jgi:hypothetical protein
MTDLDGARACGRVASRTLIFAASTSALLIACARTQPLQLSWNDELDEASASGGVLSGGGAATAGAGATGVGLGGRAGGPNGSQLGGAGSATPGGEGGSAGESGSAGEGGSAGAEDSVRPLPTCQRAITPILDGPLGQATLGSVDAAVSGDWNGDGKLDLAGSNRDGTVSVLFGYGDGSFASSAAYGSGLEVLLTQDGQTAIATSDLNADGRLDLVVGHRELSSLAVLLGQANGTFTASATYAVEGNARAIALGDFDGNGIVDIAAASRAGAVSVLLGKGNGSFGSRIATSTGDSPKSIAAADLNHDGHLDVVTVGDLELAVLLGDGSGRFSKAQVYPSHLTHNSLVAADFDADGNADLALGGTCSPSFYKDTRIEILLGHGDGTFPSRIKHEMGPNCFEQIAVGDVNGDGAADVMSSPVSALLNKGDGSFLPSRISSKTSSGNLLGLGDWNGDGKLDLAAGRNDWVAVFLGNGEGSFGSNDVYQAKFAPRSLALADLDRDGALDVVTVGTHQYHGGTGRSAVSVLRNAGDGTFSDSGDYETALYADSAATVDLNGDGLLDLITREQDSNLGVLLGTGNGRFAQDVIWSAEKSLVAFATGDLNGDGHPDVVTASDRQSSSGQSDGTGAVSLLLGHGDGRLSRQSSWPIPAAPSDVIVLDADGDGRLDIALILADSTVSVQLGKGDGSFRSGRQYRTGDGHRGITASDLDQDGKVDLVTWGTDSVSVLFGSGNGSFKRPVAYAASAAQLVVVDFDRNGTRDLVMTSTRGGITVLLGAPDATFKCAARYAVSSGMAGLGVADLNHDGRMDVATAAETGVNVFLNLSP